jgi:hypothetical protein
VGCEAGKIPAAGDVFFLDFSFYRTYQALGPIRDKFCFTMTEYLGSITAVVGIIGILIAVYFYPLIDRNVVVTVLLIEFVVVMLIRFESSVRGHQTLREAFLKRVAAIVLCIPAVFLVLNGALDTYPPTLVRTCVIHKSVSNGRWGPNYYLTMAPSWRGGRTEERLEVSAEVFSRIGEGLSARVAVHRGAFRLPWFSSVVPEYESCAGR